MSDVAQDRPEPKGFAKLFAKKNRNLLWLSLAIALAMIAGALYYAGPGSQERAAALRQQEEARVMALLLERCSISATPAVTGAQTYRCGMFVRLRDPNRVAFVAGIVVTSEGTLLRVLDHPLGELQNPPLSEFAQSSYYSRNVDAIAQAGEDGFEDLAQAWSEQEQRPVE